MKKMLDATWEKAAQLEAMKTGMAAAYFSPFSLKRAGAQVTAMEAAR